MMPDLEDIVIAGMYGVDPNAPDFRSQILDKLRIQFELAPNPMLPWSALKWARSRGLDIPGWIIDHLYDKAVVLTSIVAGNAKKEGREVARALGFNAGGKGKTAAGAKLRQQWRYYELAVRVADLLQQKVPKESAAMEAAKAMCPSTTSATAYRAYNERGAQADQFVAIMKVIREFGD